MNAVERSERAVLKTSQKGQYAILFPCGHLHVRCLERVRGLERGLTDLLPAPVQPAEAREDVDFVVGLREQPGHARDAHLPVELAGLAGPLRLREVLRADLGGARRLGRIADALERPHWTGYHHVPQCEHRFRRCATLKFFLSQSAFVKVISTESAQHGLP